MNQSRIFIISGPSGSGKNSVSAPLRTRDDCIFSVSYTTRKEIRPGEVDGVDYHFVSETDFDKAVNNNEFLEWEPVFENKYGTKKVDFDHLVKSGKKVVAVLDVKGAMNVKKLYSNVTTIFILPPNPKEAAKRLQNRQTESESSRHIREKRYNLELKFQNQYDYTILNDDLHTAQQELINIIDRKQLAQNSNPSKDRNKNNSADNSPDKSPKGKCTGRRS